MRGELARQVSGIGPDGGYLLSVLARRTYRIEPEGRCVPAEQELPLVTRAVFDPGAPGLLLADTDLFPFKLATDVIVRGSAYAPAPARSFEASVSVAGATKQILVLGDRKAALSPTGEVRFSEPAVVDRVPLGHARAYGGADAFALEKHGNPLADLRHCLPELPGLAGHNPYVYPRNPAGVGFLLEPSREAIESLTLPNLEDPADRLTPERLLARRMDRWMAQPLPASFDWLSHFWFPRVAFLGMNLPRQPDTPLVETARGYLPADMPAIGAPPHAVALRFCNGAPVGLQVPYLRGGEEIVLEHLSPDAASIRLRLPAERPGIRVDGRNGKLEATEPVIHSVIVEPDAGRVSIVWRGSAPAHRSYLAEELATMPFDVSW